MNIAAELLPRSWLLAANIALPAIVLWCALRAPWARLRAPGQLHVFLGTCVALMVLWRISASVPPGIGLHFIGATVVTLMFGARLAVICIAIVVVAQTAIGAIAPSAAPFHVLLLGAIPAAASRILLGTALRRLPAHLFVYLFVAGFLNGGVAMATTGIAAVAALALTAALPLETLLSEQLPYFLLMSWGEAFLTGGAITLLAVYRPNWLASYDQDRMLGRR